MIVKINGWINKIPIIKKIYSKILNTALHSKEDFTVNFKNIKLYITIKDPLDKIIFYKNGYEEKQIKFLSEWIRINKQIFLLMWEQILAFIH